MTYQYAVNKSNEILGSEYTPNELEEKAHKEFEPGEKYLCINDYRDVGKVLYKKGKYYELVKIEHNVYGCMYFSNTGKIAYYIKSSCVFAYFESESLRDKRKNKIKKYLEI